MRAVPHGQTFVGGAGIEQRVAAYIGGRRTLVIVRRLALEAGRNEIPIHQVLGIMKTALVGGEQKIFSFVFHSHRVGRGTERTVGTHIVVERLEVVTDVHRIAEGARQRRLWVIPPGRLGGAADCGCLVYLFFSITTSISVSSSARILFTIFSRDSRHTGARRSSLL